MHTETAYAESHLQETEVQENKTTNSQPIQKFTVYMKGAWYTVLTYPDHYWEMAKNVIDFMLRNRYTDIQLIGIGTSGAMVMALLQREIKGHLCDTKAIRVNAILLRKPEEQGSTHRNEITGSMRLNVPTFIVDDHVSSGETMGKIYQLLAKMRPEVLPFVEGVIAHNAIDKSAVQENTWREWYPNIKWLLH